MNNHDKKLIWFQSSRVGGGCWISWRNICFNFIVQLLNCQPDWAPPWLTAVIKSAIASSPCAPTAPRGLGPLNMCPSTLPLGLLQWCMKWGWLCMCDHRADLATCAPSHKSLPAVAVRNSWDRCGRCCTRGKNSERGHSLVSLGTTSEPIFNHRPPQTWQC